MAPLKVLTRISASSRTFGCTSSWRNICIFLADRRGNLRAVRYNNMQEARYLYATKPL